MVSEKQPYLGTGEVKYLVFSELKLHPVDIIRRTERFSQHTLKSGRPLIKA